MYDGLDFKNVKFIGEALMRWTVTLIIYGFSK